MLKILITIFLLSFYLCSGDTLKVEFFNLYKGDINIKFTESNTVDKFETINIKKAENRIIETDFAEEFSLTLSILDDKDNKITDFQILNNSDKSKKNNFVISAAGALTGLRCAWDENKVIVNKFQGNEFYSWLSWLPWLPVYESDIKITITNNLKKVKNENFIEFTLFAFPVKDSFKKKKNNSNMDEDLKLSTDKVNLKSWGINEKLLLNPKFFNNNNLMSRWVDLIIHNYSAQSWILYGIDQNPDSQHIKFNYPELFKDGFTVFFPPQSQLRGPGFQFGVTKKKDEIKLYPQENTKNIKDRFYFLIGMQNDLSNNDLEYIPLELLTNIRFGSYIENGVNIKGYDNYFYQAGFIPVNVGFSISSVNPEKIENKINIPVNKNGKPAFKLAKMNDVKISVESQSSDGELSAGKVGNRYIISAKSIKTGKVYKYRLILIVPPFMAGNTPGKYSPNKSISTASNIGNYVRYPLHMYLIPVNSNEVDIISEDINGKTELPNEMIGSIEYFISDRITENDQ